MWQSILTHLHSPENWLIVGLAILLGHAGGKLAGRCRLPSVVGYLAVGVLLGGSVSGMIDAGTADELGLVTDFGLGVVAFIIGSELSRSLLRRMGKSLTAILFCQFSGAVLVVMGCVWVLAGLVLPAGVPALAGALLFGAVAAATAPAGTVAVIQEYKAKGPMTRMLLAVVGLDDGMAIVGYAFAAAMAKALLGAKTLALGSVLTWPLVEILGSITLGAAAGAVLSAAAGRTRSRAELLTLSLGTIVLVTGLANVLHLSLILANLAVGVAVANISAREAERTSSSINQIVHPVYVLFFVVAGAHLDLAVVAKSGLLLVPVYIVARSGGKMCGAYVGAVIGRAGDNVRRYLGLGLLPQAGVAVGLALMASRDLAAYGGATGQLGGLLLNTIAASTIFFEIVGPIATKVALSKAGEIRVAEETAEEAEDAQDGEAEESKETGEDK